MSYFFHPEVKDLIDLYFLVKEGFDIKENIDKARLKDGGVAFTSPVP